LTSEAHPSLDLGAAGACLGDLYMLDPTGQPPWVWRDLSGQGGPEARQMMGMVAMGRYLYIFGGQNANG
jgi:hypothetical protein